MSYKHDATNNHKNIFFYMHIYWSVGGCYYGR